MKLRMIVSPFLGFYFLYAVTGKPTLGFVDWHELETYEDLSSDPEDLDLFNKLNFTFSCMGRAVGLYADQEYACRVFHACDEAGQGIIMVCGNQTKFNQRHRVCDWESEVDCEKAREWYYLNELTFGTDPPEEYEIEEEEVQSVLPLLSP